MVGKQKKRKGWTLSKKKRVVLITGIGVLLFGSIVCSFNLKNKNNNSSVLLPLCPLVNFNDVVDDIYINEMELRIFPLSENVKNSISKFDAKDNYQFEDKLNEYKMIINDIESHGIILVNNYNDLKNIIYMANFMEPNMELKNSQSFMIGIEELIYRVIKYNMSFMPDKCFSLATLYGIQNPIEGQIVNTFEQYMYWIIKTYVMDPNAKVCMFKLCKDAFLEQLFFLTNYIPAIIDEEEIYFDELSDFTKLILLTNFNVLNNIVKDDFLPDSIFLDTFNKENKELEHVEIDLSEILSKFIIRQHDIIFNMAEDLENKNTSYKKSYIKK